MTTERVWACTAGLVWLLTAPPALAQPAAGFRPRQLTVSAGAVLAKGYPVGDTTVTLQSNALGTPPPFTLLRAESRLERALGVEGRVAFALSRAFAVEAGGVYGRPDLVVTVSGDPEAASGAEARARVQQFGVEVSGLYQLPMSWGRRTVPYAIGGGGYLRQLHDGRLLVQTGGTMHAGAGLQHWFRPAGAGRRGLGARAEARYVRRMGGVEFEERARNLATISLLAFVAF